MVLRPVTPQSQRGMFPHNLTESFAEQGGAGEGFQERRWGKYTQAFPEPSPKRWEGISVQKCIRAQGWESQGEGNSRKTWKYGEQRQEWQITSRSEKHLPTWNHQWGEPGSGGNQLILLQSPPKPLELTAADITRGRGGGIHGNKIRMGWKSVYEVVHPRPPTRVS